MRDTLYIRLSGDDTCETCLSPAKGLRQRAVRVPLADALNNAAGCRLVVFVPSAEVRLTSVSVPAKQPQKILQAAPYALEDQFAEDVDTLHFAIGDTLANDRTPVAVVSRSVMNHWLEPFRTRGLMPDLLLPDVFGLPLPSAGRWQVLAESAQATVRSDTYAGFTCAVADLPAHLQLSDAGNDQSLSIYPIGPAMDFSALGARADIRPGSALGLDCLAASLEETLCIDLLQGIYGRGHGTQALWKPWRLTAALAVLWAVIALTLQGISAVRLGKELAQQEDANLQRFQKLFPAETRIVDLAVQAEQQFTQLKGGGVQSGLFPLLDAARSALAGEAGLVLQSLQLKDGALFLSLTGNDLQALDRLRDGFAKRSDVKLEVQSANSSSIGVQIRLKITPA
ncbi:MAG: type II secretion system protein GspL [Pseudomonadota bacterium]